MILGSVLLEVAVIQHNQTTLCNQCLFPYDQNKDIKKASLLSRQHLNNIIKTVARDKSHC